ncbi:MAG: protoheme IX farnesyltransferase [Candidatus Latescibacterota bacterium]|nr:MAG: protoheme IX farnesyltransferase [Candidatus Latescibacterota bacterium]
MSTTRRHVDTILRLGKARISSLATISMIAGYVLAHGNVSWPLVSLTLGVFLLACGSSALNQIQEREIDGRMRRTMGRPLPTGRASLAFAAAVSSGCLIAGSLAILWSSNPQAMALGILAVVWYNVVYTPLKRVTAFAAVPGGVVGAIPPVIGWVAGGGSAADPRILAVAFFFFMWQIPHFWLLLLSTGGEEYESAGLPSLTRFFSLEQIARITFMWILGTAMVCLVIPLFGVIESAWINMGLFVAGLWLVWRSARILRSTTGGPAFRHAFKHVNLYVCWVISLLAIGGVLS